MQSPNNSDDSSHPTETPFTFTTTRSRRISSTQPSSTRKPKSNPHKYFLERTEKNCPKHLTDSQRNKWFKVAKKANANAQLVRQLPPFRWPTSHSIQPIFIHHLTPHSIIDSVLHQIRDVTVYVIDTESDPPTPFRSESLPALIQIQAIHHENSTSVLIIETQFLPYPSSPTLFRRFALFDIDQIKHPVNLQAYFTTHWNQTHHHLSSCPTQHHQSQIKLDSDSDSDYDLICAVDTSKFDDDLQFNRVTNKSTCTCPDDIRPYKDPTNQWALQKAIKVTFNEALNKLHTMNTWACALDPILTTDYTSDSTATRTDMIVYAVNDVCAPARLLFQLDHLIIRHLRSSSLSTTVPSTSLPSSNSPEPQSPEPSTPEPQPSLSPLHIQQSPEILSDQEHVPELPMYFVLTDSHARHIKEPIITPHYQALVHAISGLRWRDSTHPHLSALSIIKSSSISTYLQSSAALMFLIGTNSLRYDDAAKVLQDVAHTIEYIHTTYPHLHEKQQIAVVATFPCYNTSGIFKSIHSLLSNIQVYNEELHTLSNQLNFTFIDFHITDIYLSSDRMHLHPNYRYLVPNSITHYFNSIFQHHTSSRTHTRSQSAIQRRNQRRHAKLKLKQQQFSIKRPIDLNWKPIHVKQVLKQHHIKYARILEVRNHIVPIQFNNAKDRDAADTSLPDDIFNSEHFHQYFNAEQ
ncbi:unnamed protein product [Rotaria sordida]|uniref:Uncharacterized protein n=1 Tax=Rotaria sordida TaxID=392033 RepID=A0A819PKS5_9BILA|nr:unnamed protein product [Rotaria sordida]